MPSPQLRGGPRAASALACAGTTVAVASSDAPCITVWECCVATDCEEIDEVAPTQVFTVRGSKCLLVDMSRCAREMWTLSDEALQGWRINDDDAWAAFFELPAADLVASSILRSAFGGTVAVCADTELRTMHQSGMPAVWKSCTEPGSLIADAQFITLSGLVELSSLVFVSEDGVCRLWDVAAGEILCRVPNPLADGILPTALATWEGALCVAGDAGQFALLEVRRGTMAVYETGDLAVGAGTNDATLNSITGVDWRHDSLLLSFASRVVIYDTICGRVVEDARCEEDVASARGPLWPLGWLVSLSCFDSSICVRKSAALLRVSRAREPESKTIGRHPDFGVEPAERIEPDDRVETDERAAADDLETASRLSVDSEPEALSVFPSADPPESSALRRVPRAALRLKNTNAPKTKSKNSLDKPVTFHKAIKSSGYGTPPQVRSLFKTAAQERAAKGRQHPRGSRGVSEALRSRAGGAPSYPCDCGPIDTKLAIPAEVEAHLKHQGATLKIKYSLDGSMLGTSGSDNAVRAIKLPLSKHKGDGANFVGHHAKVHSIDFSYLSSLIRVAKVPPRPLMLTGCADGSAMLWSTTMANPLSVFAAPNSDGAACNSSVKESSTRRSGMDSEARSKRKSNTGGGGGGSSTQASFFYLDQFVLVSSGSQVRMHRYEIDERAIAPSRDVDTQREKNKQKAVLQAGVGSANQAVVASWDCGAEAKSILGFAAMNAFHSHLVLTSRSDGSIAAIDVAADRVLRVARMPDRAAHTITLPTLALHAAHPPGAFDMFVTSSTSGGGTVQIWDLRQREPAQTLRGHLNRVHAVGASISPCMRYVATGSEDNSCYIYDVRTGEVQTRLWQPHKDTVSDVSFHPIMPYLATACHDGGVRCYGVC